MIESINVWKRTHDNKYSVCILIKMNQDEAPDNGTDHVTRSKMTFDTLLQALTYVTTINNTVDAFNAGVPTSKILSDATKAAKAVNSRGTYE